MKNKKFDYYSEALAYLKLKAGGAKITQRKYCEKRAADTGFRVSIPYFKKMLVRIRQEHAPRLSLTKNNPAATTPSMTAEVLLADPQWPALRAAYTTGKFASLSDVARHLGLRPDHRGFRQAVAGWRDERSRLAPAISARTVEAVVEYGATAKVRDIYAEALAAHFSLLDIVTESAKFCKTRWSEPDKTPWHSQMAAQAAMDLSKAMEKILPAIKGLENLQAIHSIFDDLSAGGDIVKAAFDLAKLGVTMPKPIEIMLTKHKPDDTSPDDGEVISDAAIMARRAELLEEIQTERVEFVRERKKLVAELRNEAKDSFANSQQAPK
jgi:hypothetical protein